MASDGRVMRFPHSPVSVYVEDPPVPERIQHAYMSDVEYALDQWMGCSEGLLQFEQVDSEDADVRIYWTEGILHCFSISIPQGQGFHLKPV